jgi:uncharacterized membrane protein YhhN
MSVWGAHGGWWEIHRWRVPTGEDGAMRPRSLAATGYLALAAADTVLAGRSGSTARRLRCLTKPALMPALGTAFLDATHGRRDLLRQATAAAQVFSWGGDVALLGKSERAFLAGVGSFFAAHAAYLVGFWSVRGQPRERAAAGPRAALAIWATMTPALAIAAGHKDRKLRGPVAAYATILAGMFASSTVLDPALPPRACHRIEVGTALFLVSDAVLGIREFLLDGESAGLDSLVMATYTAGQALIAAGVAGT